MPLSTKVEYWSVRYRSVLSETDVVNAPYTEKSAKFASLFP